MEGQPLSRAWYIVARKQQLKRPISFTLNNVPLAIFRSRGGVTAVLDRCPHRGAPLSCGTVKDGLLQCAYHGWQFDHRGQCRNVPALATFRAGQAHQVPIRPAVEQQGFIWVCSEPTPPPYGPPIFPRLGHPDYTHFVEEAEIPSDLVSTAENILDVPHTAFLHGGWFRKEPHHLVNAEVTRTRNSVEVEFIGEKPPGGLLGQLLVQKGQKFLHKDRFKLPSIAEVEYQLGETHHLIISSALTPISEERTKLFSVASIKLSKTVPLVLNLAQKAARRVLQQDVAILRSCKANQKRFNKLRDVSTEADLLRHHIIRLLEDANRGEETLPSKRVIQLRV